MHRGENSLYRFCAFVPVWAGSVGAAVPIRPVIAQNNAIWESLHLQVAPFPQMLHPPPPELRPTVANPISFTYQEKNGAEVSAELSSTSSLTTYLVVSIHLS
jgi:hypothetical protein